jgi:hypothetical protein
MRKSGDENSNSNSDSLAVRPFAASKPAALAQMPTENHAKRHVVLSAALETTALAM